MSCFIFLFLDYDGTIVPIKKQPSLAVLPPKMSSLLTQLSLLSNIMVGVITGRSLNDIRNLVGIGDILYAANHGTQIYHKKQTWIHPGAKRSQPLVKKMELAFVKALAPIEGVIIENKGLTLSVHYRNVKSGNVLRLKRILKQIIQPFQELVKLSTGKKVVEIRPNIQWNKGHAILKILKDYRATDKSIIVFIGDDQTDEDAFKLLPSKAITIRVGKNKYSKAKYYLRNTSEVKRLLECMISLKQNY